MPIHTGKREPAVIAGLAYLNGHIRYVSSSRSDHLQSVQALHPQDEDGKRVTISSFTLYRLPEPMQRAEALAYLVTKYQPDEAEHKFLSSEHIKQVKRDTPKGERRTGVKGKPRTEWFTPPVDVNVTVERTAPKRANVRKPKNDEATAVA